MTDEEILKKLHEIMDEKKLSQRKLADLIDVGICTLNRILKGKHKIIPSRRKKFVTMFKMYDSGMLI